MTKTPIAVPGIDLGKSSCSLAGMDAAGAVVMRKRMTRDAIVRFAATLPACVIAMEACCGAHFLGRVRERLVNARTALIDQLRAVLLGRGIIVPQGPYQPDAPSRRTHGRRSGCQRPHRHVAGRPSQRVAGLDQRVEAYDDEPAALTREDVQTRRLATIPGIGVINATALLAAIGDGSAFGKGRDLAAWLGLTPRQHSTAARPGCWGSASAGTGICASN